MNIQDKSRFIGKSVSNENFLSNFTNKELIVTIKNPFRETTSELSSDREEKEDKLQEKYKKALKTLKDYISKDNNNAHIGRVWILIGEEDNNTPINVGQTINLYKELSGIIGGIFITQKGPYYEELSKYNAFHFYEVKPEEMISKFCETKNISEDELKDLAYDMVKDYFAEVLLAQFSLAKNWNRSVSAIDKRFLSWLEEHYGDEYKFDKSRKGKST